MIRVALICDFAEELWPSMDLVGQMLFEHLNAPGSAVEAVIVRPPMQRVFSGNARRLWNRFGYYPWVARRLAGFDLYHVLDHSYAQLIHCLPASRTVVTCHDTDTFRCLLEPEREPRPLWFREMTRTILAGLRKAPVVTCVSEATRGQLLRHRVVPEDRLRVIHNGVHPAFSAVGDSHWDYVAEQLIVQQSVGRSSAAELLHVGSTIPRKRIDVLLKVVAELGRHIPVRLIRVGGAFTKDQEELVTGLGLRASIVSIPFAETALLAALYRRAAAVLIPSEAEGFGLPLAEAFACGTPVLASDIPALREVGGDAATYAEVQNIPEWTAKLLDLVSANAPLDKSLLIRRAKRFSWSHHARELTSLYLTYLSANNPLLGDEAGKFHAEKDYRHRRRRIHRVQRGEPLSAPGSQSRSLR